MTSPSQIPVSLEALRQRKLSSESAWLLSLASRLAGESSEAAGETLAAWGFESGEFFSEGRTKGFLAATAEVILIAFSVDNDVIRGVEAAVVDRPNGEVNAAAHVAFEEVAKLIRTALSILKPEGKALWLTGHGLGGAVAIIAAAELEAEFTGDRIFSVPPGFRQVQQLVRLDFGDAEEMATEGGAAPGRSLDRYIDRLQAQVETERLKRRDTTATRGGDARPVSPTN